MLNLHFLNVGHGDCKIIQNDETKHVSMIDINMSDDMDDTTTNELLEEAFSILGQRYRRLYETCQISGSQALTEAKYAVKLQNPINYCIENNLTNIFRFISTHPHMDHISGIADLYSKLSVHNTWILRNNFKASSLSASQQIDWDFYTSLRDTTDYETQYGYIVRPMEKDFNDFWNIDGIEILAPNSELLQIAKKKNNPNIMSYVLLLTYGKHKIIFGADAEKETWEYVTNTYASKITDISILDASHHGRDTGYYQPAVKLMSPQYVIVSVGKKPQTDASNKYRKYSNNVLSTRWHGNIKFKLEQDGSGTIETEYDH